MSNKLIPFAVYLFSVGSSICFPLPHNVRNPTLSSDRNFHLLVKAPFWEYGLPHHAPGCLGNRIPKEAQSGKNAGNDFAILRTVPEHALPRQRGHIFHRCFFAGRDLRQIDKLRGIGDEQAPTYILATRFGRSRREREKRDEPKTITPLGNTGERGRDHASAGNAERAATGHVSG